MQIPAGKTQITVIDFCPQSHLEKGSGGYIDGYIRGGDGVPCAVVVREDGRFDFAPIHSLRAASANGGASK